MMVEKKDEEYMKIQETRADYGLSGPGWGELSPWGKEFLEMFSHYIQEPILDVGSGDGRFISELVKQGKFSMGIDISRSAVKKGHMNHMPIVWANMEEEFPFPDETFNTITSFASFEHARYPEIVIKNMQRVLKKDGYLCVVCPASDLDIPYAHFAKIPTFEYFRSLFDGMEIMEMSEMFCNNYIIIAKKV